MNLSTYFKMKIRAGTVGSKGLAPLIDRLAQNVDRVHLVGHSFGGRLVTAAAMDSKTPSCIAFPCYRRRFRITDFPGSKADFFAES